MKENGVGLAVVAGIIVSIILLFISTSSGMSSLAAPIIQPPGPTGPQGPMGPQGPQAPPERSIPTNTGWSASHSGGGGSLNIFMIELNTGIAANSRALYRSTIYGLNNGTTYLSNLDWDNYLEFNFGVQQESSDAQTVARVQIKNVNTEGQLTDLGIGIQVSNYAVVGEAYGTSRGTVALGTLIEGSLATIRIVHNPGASVDFYYNGVYKGSLTGTVIPLGIAGTSYIVDSIINGVAGGVDSYSHLLNPRIIYKNP